jgi:hypothetical protein
MIRQPQLLFQRFARRFGRAKQSGVLVFRIEARLRRYRMLRFAAAFILVFIHSAVAETAMPSADQIVGTWRLVAASATSGDVRDNAPYGPAPAGIITYTDDGRVMAIISHSGRKPLTSGDRISASTDERAEAFATSFSYAGRYSLSEDKIIHHVEIASVQNWVGTDLVRLVRLEKNRITLTTPPLSVGGKIKTTDLVWERVE